MKRTRLVVLLGLTLCILAGTLAIQQQTLGQDSPRELLRGALDRAVDAGSYQVQMSLDQAVRQEIAAYFGPQEEWAHFEIEGSISAPDRARFAILPGRTSFSLAQKDPQEFLAVGSAVYHRAGDRWMRSDPGTAVVEVDGIGLSLLSAASDVEHLDPAKGPLALGEHSPTFQRVGFELHSEDVSRFLLVQQGITDPQDVALAKLSSPSIEGAGELWIDDAGLPARLVLDLEWVRGGAEPYRTHAVSTTDYSNFGLEFPPNHFDPAASPQTGVPLSLSLPRWQVQPGLWLAIAVVFLTFCWLLVRARTGSRRATVVVTVALIAGLLAPSLVPVAESAGLRQAPGESDPPAPGSEFARMLEETAALASGYSPSSLSKASALPEDQDDDGDGFPNRYELHLGTSPFAADSDYDGLSDWDEVRGVLCPTDTNPNFRIETDPLNPDSNYDGLKDGAEYYRGQCRNGFMYGYAWEDDNDGDGVPDGLDLSPFSTSLGGPQGWLGEDHAGPNLTFDTLDQDPGEVLDPYPFYVEIQIRPTHEESLRWAFKNLQWPGDFKGAIQSTPPLLQSLYLFTTGQNPGSSGRITLVPLLQATLRESDLPSQKAMDHYGVSVSPHKDEQGNPVVENGEALYDMVVPLAPVERGGQVFAFQAKMLHDAGTSPSLTRHWRDLRFKWAVLGDVLLPDSDTGQHVRSPDGGYGLVVYDEAYHLTGLQVSRQGGASMLVAAPLPYPLHQGEQFDASRISLLRAGMEAHFLTGRLDLAEIKTRFDEGSGAGEADRWGLPNDWFRVRYDESMDYEHLDEAIATTTMTTTVQLFNDEYYDHFTLEPTLVMASEQKTSTVNLDDDPATDYLDITINSCLKPLITSRSLKLQTYRWHWDGLLGEWEPLSLDEVLQKVEIEYAGITDPNYEFYNEELNIIKMATTAWQVGMTSLLKIGQVDIQDLEKVLTDPETVQSFLDANGLLPDVYKDVIDVLLEIEEAGGPLAWLEAQWNKVVGVFDAGTGLVDAIGSFLDYSPETSPPSAKATSPGSEEAPAEPGEPIDQTLLGWTETAINVLNFLATVTGWEWLGDLADILTKVVEIYQKIRALWDTTKAIVDNAGKVAQAAVQTMAQELSSLSKPLGLVGLIFAVAMIWLAVALQIGDAGPSIALTLVLRALVETYLVIVLFVLAAVFPWGTVAAILIGLSMALSNLTGVTLDPVTALINWLFDVDVIERTELHGQPVLDPLDMKPLEPGGGLLSGRQFELSLHSSITMRTVNEGTAGDLNQSDAKMHIGRYTAAPNLPVSVCTPSQELFDDYKSALTGYIHSLETAQNYYCVNFIIPHEIGWLLTPAGFHYGASPEQVPPGVYEREFQSTPTLIVEPGAKINGQLLLDVSMDVTIRHDECSTIAGCDGDKTLSTSAPSIAPLYFDILPPTVYGVWHWAQLINRDPDGDGLMGYISEITQQPTGPDADLCPNIPGLASWEIWDRDYDGLSDKFEVEREGFDPCMADSDGDGLQDGWELMVGTSPDDADTDDDGLSDRQELALGRSIYDESIYTVSMPWYVQMQEPYPLLPAPAAFPNPRQHNLDGDHRKDSQEKSKLSSPNAYDALPVGEALGLSIGQAFTNGGGTSITVSSSFWPNDEAAGVDATLTITLPVVFSDVALNAMLFPPLVLPGFDAGTLLASEPAHAQWSLPPMTLGRNLYATYSGTPTIPSQPVTVTAELRYTEGTATRVVTATAPLLVNDGGPVSAFTGVPGAVQQNGGARALGSPGPATTLAAAGDGTVTITGTSTDPQGTWQVLVCAKQTDTCDGADWQQATLIAGIAGGYWTYDFDPPADGLYYVRAYAIDSFELTGPVTDAMIIGVDRAPPSGVSFDLSGTAYLSSTLSAGPPGITLTGRISDTTGTPYVSGVDAVALAIGGGGDEQGAATVAEPGQPSSPFAFRWEPPAAGFGRSVRNTTGVHTVTVGGSDVAGNVSVVSDTLRVLVDDTPPVAYGRPPQVSADTTITLSGLADDTALLYQRQPPEPFSSGLTVADRDTQFDVDLAGGRALVVGDVTGDLIDEVLLLAPSVPGVTPFQAGLFFGRAGPGGWPELLSLDAADVIFQGGEGVPDLAPAAAGIGDVNGDGVGDLLLGDPNAASGEGLVYLILGRRGGGWSSPVSLADADWQLSVPGAIGFGGSVAGAGDVNGDGLADVVVGGAGILDQAGATWLFPGREQGTPTAEIVFYSPPGAVPVPPDLAGLGDSNGDGLSDLLIASPGAEVALVYGRPDGEWPASPTGLGTHASALFDAFGSQQTVSPAGDLNGDGLGDMLIGDPEAGTPHVFILYGRRPEEAWPAAPIVTAIDDALDASFVEYDLPGSRLGTGLAALGDVDWDGLDDFSFGQPGSGAGQDRTAVVLTGRLALVPDMPVEAATYIIDGTAAASQRSGEYLSAGDVTGDRIPDLLIGAAGDNQAYLFHGGFDPGAVAGIARVEVGVYGPVVDATQPVTLTMPADWLTTTLSNPGDALSAWSGTVTVPGDGDYRAYARAFDRAGNRQEMVSQYLGNVWVSDPASFPVGSSASMDDPELVDQTELALSGSIDGAASIQHLRAFNGYQWSRLTPATGPWSWNSTIPRNDLSTLTFRVVARDGLGGTLHAARELGVDSLVDRPQLSANLVVNDWHTDEYPELTITWPAVGDGSGIVDMWAAIDTSSSTEPTVPVGTNEVASMLDEPAAYYGHVRVRDGDGNEHTVHAGPFLLNRTQTPSVILADGYLDHSGGEYPAGTLLNYDPYAALKPAALWGTWDSDRLYLAYPGQAWGTDSLLAIYLDTIDGGLSSTLAPFGSAHTLPFAADFAFVVGGSSTEGGTLYAAGGSGPWTAIESPASYAVSQIGTEIVLDRSEIEATGPVQLVAFAENSRGVWAVLPGGARPATSEWLTETVVFGEALTWDSLGEGAVPGEGQAQAIAPSVTLNPAWDNVLFSDQTTVFAMTVTNPDVGPYERVPLTLEAGPELVLNYVSGADCDSCPSGASEWTLYADVAAGGTQTVTVEAMSQGENLSGVFPLTVTASLANSGLPAEPQSAASMQYNLDQGVGILSFLDEEEDEMFLAAPGEPEMSVIPNFSGIFNRCLQKVEANYGGSSWSEICDLGDCTSISDQLLAGTTEVWEVRVAGANGQNSAPISRTVVADDDPPTAQISPTLVLSGTLAFVRGLASDESPITRPPATVEVSVDGGRFYPAHLSTGGQTARSSDSGQQEPSSTAKWLFPLWLTSQDGTIVEVVARAVDQAGNVGPGTEPVEITLDNRGPSMTASQNEGWLEGTASDGSGVASVSVSLDGGAHYQPVALAGEAWAFELSSWVGSWPQPFAMLRAADVWGNVTHELLPVEMEYERLYLPLVLRSG